MLDSKPTYADVVSLYRLLLGREPEDEAIVEKWATVPTVKLLVDSFLASPEFQLKHPPFAEELSPPPPPTEEESTAQLASLRRLIDKIAERDAYGQIYQPIYGVPVDHPYNVQRECIKRCELVLDQLAGLPTKRMTVTDVGAHMGFMSFYLAERFARVVGIEADPLLYEFCTALKAVNASRASFRQIDFFNNYGEIWSDVCLLFSVVHYLVGSTTLAKAKRQLADIVNHFDFTIIEMSSSRDYAYMPADPAELLADIKDADIRQIGVSEKNQRPIYLIARTVTPCGGRTRFNSILYPEPIPAVSCTRVYVCEDTVLKVVPLDDYAANEEKFRREVEAYRRLSGAPYLPSLIDTGVEGPTGWMRLSRARGRQLCDLYLKLPESGAADKETLICRVIDIVSHMASQGLYWNDLSSHNVMVEGDDVKIIDLGEAGEIEGHDHIAMLTWFLHDLQLWKSRSYENGAYPNVLNAARNPETFTQARFVERSGTFFATELQWLYDAVAKATSLAELLGDEPLMTRIRQAATRPLAFAQPEAGPLHTEWSWIGR